MIATITLGSCVSVQGTIVQMLKDGRMTIRVGAQLFTGKAIAPQPEPARVGLLEPKAS
jgi:hypothetical protein